MSTHSAMSGDGPPSASHLELLRGEYAALQLKCEQTQRRLEEARAKLSEGGQEDKDSSETLVGQLLAGTRRLLETHDYCDIVFVVEEKQLQTHKFLLSCRSPLWRDLAANCQEILIEDVTFSTWQLIYRWLYTDEIDLSESRCEDSQLIDIAAAALRYKLSGLSNKCIVALQCRLCVSNCISIYSLAEREGIDSLRKCCAALVAEKWDEFTRDDFAKLSAPLLYRLLKGHSSHLLHAIITLCREDVLFLFFVEFDTKLAEVINQTTADGESPLELSLRLGYTQIAKQLVEKGASVDLRDSEDNTILMRMLRKGNVAACDFLSHHGADLKSTASRTGFSLLHHAAEGVENREEVAQWIKNNKDTLNIDEKDADGRTPLHLSILSSNAPLFSCLLSSPHSANPNSHDSAERTPLFAALFQNENTDFVRHLVEKGADINAVIDKNPLICHAVTMPNDEDALRLLKLLIQYKANVNLQNVSNKKTALHVAVERRSEELTRALLTAGAIVDVKEAAEGDTQLHTAVRAGHNFTRLIVEHANELSCSLKNKHGTTALRLALNAKDFESASLLVRAGADVLEKGREGKSLLCEAIEQNDDLTAVFLLQNGGKDEESGPESWLEMACRRGLSQTVKTLCSIGVNINQRMLQGKGYTVLKVCLENGHYECARLLVSFGIDVNSWTVTEDAEQTLLHHWMDVSNQEASVFLIENGCDVNACKRYSRPEDDDMATPLHMAVAWGQMDVLKALIKHGANFDLQDSDGRTPCHIAVRERHHSALSCLLLAAEDVSFVSMRDRLGHTCLSQALANRDHESANLIVNRVPHAALQTNGNGENLLHIAVKSGDLEGVLFLLATHVDVSALTTDASRKTALHLAAAGTNEMITRNLLLAGCPINARTEEEGRTALHVAVACHSTQQCLILLENKADPNIQDDQGNNALLLAVKSGAIDCVQALLTDKRVVTTAANKKGQSALHLCAALSQDKLPKRRTIAELCDVLLSHEERRSNDKELAAYIEIRDSNGNTPLLLAYISANSPVCRQLLRRGASMGARNSDGHSIFTHEMPTKQLLFSLLESLEREPRWSDCEVCDCGTKFSITQRKHHCRHCGRVVCAKCSEVQMPIVKFGEEKKVRVCSLCAQILTTGYARR